MAAASLPHESLPNPDKTPEKSTLTQGKLLRRAVQALARHGAMEHDEYAGVDTWEFMDSLEPEAVSALPERVTRHFPEAEDTPYTIYRVAAGYNVIPEGVELSGDLWPDSVTIERTIPRRGWHDVATIEYTLGDPSETNPSGIRRSLSNHALPLPFLGGVGAEVEYPYREDEASRMLDEARQKLENPREISPAEAALQDELSCPDMQEASDLIAFTRRFAAQQPDPPADTPGR